MASALAALGYITVIVFLFYEAAQPVITYEQVSRGTLPETVCPGQEYQFQVHATANKAPATVAVIENWVSTTEPSMSVLDDAIQWRIIARPVDGMFVIDSDVPWDIKPGQYVYLRALGLNDPLILEVPVTVIDRATCAARRAPQPSP